MRYLILLIWTLLIVVSSTSKLRAALTIVVQPNKATYAPGETARMSLFAYATQDPADDIYLQGFQLAFDLKPQDGKGYSQTSFTSPDGLFGGINGIYSNNTNFQKNDPSFANFDFSVTADTANNNPANSLNGKNAGNAIKLATVTFNISATASAGNYSFVFKPNALLVDNSGVNIVTLNGTTYTEGDLGEFIASGGAFTISGEAIPEPTTITLLAIGLAGGVACRRFRKRSSSVGPATDEKAVA